MAVKEKHPHYYKNVENLKTIDVYRVLQLFGVTDPAIQHAVKKLLVAGGRGGGKDITRDVQEAIDTLERFLDMRREEAPIVVNVGMNSPMGVASLEEIAAGLQRAFVSMRPDVSPSFPKGIIQRTMSQDTKRDLAARKARKRAAKRGR